MLTLDVETTYRDSLASIQSLRQHHIYKSELIEIHNTIASQFFKQAATKKKNLLTKGFMFSHLINAKMREMRMNSRSLTQHKIDIKWLGRSQWF